MIISLYFGKLNENIFFPMQILYSKLMFEHLKRSCPAGVLFILFSHLAFYSVFFLWDLSEIVRDVLRVKVWGPDFSCPRHNYPVFSS